jgi:UDP:flavonoid glycosyltransferase YjiC (YdhE family)
MRFLFCTRPFLGHFYPMVPLARELVRHGHQVVVASSAELESEVIAAGLEFRRAGLHTSSPLPHRPGEERRAAAGFAAARLESKISDLLTIEGADVVVREPTDLAAGIVAEATSTPLVVLGRSHHMSAADWGRVLGGDLDDIRAEAGLPPDPQLSRLPGDVYLDAVPPWFYATPPSSAQYAAIDGGSYDGASTEPFPRYPPMPYTYVTLGTVYNGDVEFFRVAVAALRERGLAAFVSAGSDDSAAALAPLAADDCVVRRFQPQSQVLCGAEFVLCHGGYSTVIGAIKAGLPVICVPRGSDQEANSRQCERLGAGIRLSPAEWHVQGASEAIARLLGDHAFARRARMLADRDDHLPSLDDAATLLEELPGLTTGESPVQRLKAIAASRPRSYRFVNEAGWRLLSRRGSAASRPLPSRSAAEARRILDPEGWLPWPRLRTVLCLAAGGGQQGPLFAGLGYDVLVVDLSAEQLRRDREAATRQRLRIETLQADMCDLAALGERQFDLVYQPVSTCYVPHLPTLYRQVAMRVRPGGWYWSRHYSPAHLQIDSSYQWDGAAYRIAHPQIEGYRVPWTTGDGDWAITVDHYVHGFGALTGGICDAGFAIERVRESEPGPGTGQPGEFSHLNRYFPAFLTMLARRHQAIRTGDEH